MPEFLRFAGVQVSAPFGKVPLALRVFKLLPGRGESGKRAVAINGVWLRARIPRGGRSCQEESSSRRTPGSRRRFIGAEGTEMTDELEYTESSGSVWEDLGHPDAEERMAKALLSRWIDKQIQVRGLNQTQAAELLGVSQPEVSKLVRGRVAGFSLERLARMINALGHDVRISVAPQEDRERAHLLVSV